MRADKKTSPSRIHQVVSATVPTQRAGSSRTDRRQLLGHARDAGSSPAVHLCISIRRRRRNGGGKKLRPKRASRDLTGSDRTDPLVLWVAWEGDWCGFRRSATPFGAKTH